MSDIHKLTDGPQLASDEDQDPFILRSGLDLGNEAMLQTLTRDPD